MMSRNFLFFIILLVGCLTQVASDIYTPAVPSIAHDLNASLSLVQWSMAIYMLGVGITQVIYGVVSEGIGRKIPMLFGLSVMVIGSIICATTTHIHILILGRFIQGCGAGACSAMWRSIFRDTFSGNDLAKYGSYLTAFVVFIIPVAPALGGYMTHYLTWRSTFIFLTLYTLVAFFFVSYGYTETSKHHHLERLKIAFIKSTFRQLLSDRVFLGLIMIVFMTYGGMFAWMVAAPVLLIHLGGMGPVAFGWFLFLGGGGGYAFSGFINGRYVHRFGMSNMMRLGWAIMLLSGILLLASYFLLGISVWAMAACMVLYFMGSTFVYPNANALALTPFGKIAGYAGSTYGFFQVIGAAILGGLISHLHESNQIPVAILTIIVSILAWLSYEIIVHSSTKESAPN